MSPHLLNYWLINLEMSTSVDWHKYLFQLQHHICSLTKDTWRDLTISLWISSTRHPICHQPNNLTDSQLAASKLPDSQPADSQLADNRLAVCQLGLAAGAHPVDYQVVNAQAAESQEADALQAEPHHDMLQVKSQSHQLSWWSIWMMKRKRCSWDVDKHMREGRQ